MFESSSQYCKIIFGHLQVNSTFLIGPKILRICKRSVGQGRGDKKKYICWSQWFICQMLRLLHRAQKWIVGPGRIDKTRSLCCGHEEFSLCSIFLRWTLNLKVGLGRRDMMNLMFKAVNTFDVPRLWPRTPNFQIARGHTDMMFFLLCGTQLSGYARMSAPDPKFQCWQRHQGKSLGQTALNQHWNLGPGEPTEARAMIVHVCFKGGGGGTFFPSTVLWGRPSLLLQSCLFSVLVSGACFLCSFPVLVSWALSLFPVLCSCSRFLSAAASASCHHHVFILYTMRRRRSDVSNNIFVCKRSDAAFVHANFKTETPNVVLFQIVSILKFFSSESTRAKRAHVPINLESAKSSTLEDN